MKLEDFKDFISHFMAENAFTSFAVINRKKYGFYPNMFKTVEDAQRPLNLADKNNFCNYFSLNNFHIAKREEENVKNINGFMFDFDDGDLSKIEKILEELGNPFFEINTTPSKNKFQLIYLLKTPVNIQTFNNNNEDWMAFLKQHLIISKTLTDYFKSDRTFDIPRICRLPYGKNGKNSEEITFKQNNIKYNWNYFQDFIIKNNIPFSTLDEVKKSPKKTAKTAVKTAGAKAPDINFNGEKQYIDLYIKAFNKYQDNSRARYSFIQILINKRMNDTRIKEISQSLGFEEVDTNRIISRIRS